MAKSQKPKNTESPVGTPDAPPAREALSDKQLARAILDRAFRPRISEVRRLAEAVLDKKAKKARKGKKDAKAKLARLPGQPKGKKKHT
jgi:hypothetical protein